MNRQLNIDALDAVRIFAQALQRNHHIFVDFEGVGVLGDGGGASTVEPEGFALFGRCGDKAFAVAGARQCADVFGSSLHLCFVVRHHIGNQHHFRAAFAGGFGGIAHGTDVPPVQMLQAGQFHRCMRLHEIADFHNGRRGIGHRAEKFQAHGARVFGHFVQHERGTGDDAVRAFFLHARQAAQEFVGNVLAQPHFAEFAACNFQRFGFQHRFPVVVQRMDMEHGGFFVMDFAEIVAHALHLHPFALRIDHFPPRQIVQRRAPQHSFFAARVHGHVAADAGCVRRSGVHGKHQPRRVRCLFHPPRYHACTAHDNRVFAVQTCQRSSLHPTVPVQFFRVNHGAHRVQRHRAACVARAAAARNNRQIQLD